MTKPPAADQVRYLLLRRFPAADMLRLPPTLSHRGGQASADGLQDRKTRREEVEAYERELTSMPPAALTALFDQERAIACNEIVRRAEREEQDRFFNQPHAKADFAYWIKAAHWTLDEAIALSSARRPSMSAGRGSRTWCRFPRLPSNISGKGTALRARQWNSAVRPGTSGTVPGVGAANGFVDFP